MISNDMKFTERFGRAVGFAVKLHDNQMRKGTTTPYIAHLLSVAALVIEFGGDEDEAIAGVLHDAVEDQGGIDTYNLIQERFGSRVASIVDGCTDTYQFPKPPWLERKKRYLEHLVDAPLSVQRVSLADKLHNARSLLHDLRSIGDDVWSRFNGGKEGSLWYYRSLANIFKESPLAESDQVSLFVDDFVRVVEQIEELSEKLSM